MTLRMVASRLTMAGSSRLRVPAGRVERETVRNAQSWRKWYKTGRWRALRAAVLTRDLFTCAMCAIVVSAKGQAVVDHRRPHRGDDRLFWDEGNLWTLCKPCHDRVKQRLERKL